MVAKTNITIGNLFFFGISEFFACIAKVIIKDK